MASVSLKISIYTYSLFPMVVRRGSLSVVSSRWHPPEERCFQRSRVLREVLPLRRTIGKRLGIRSGTGGRGGAGVGDEVLRCNLYLEAADASTDKDAGQVKGAQVDKGGERLLHPDGRAAAADIAGKGQKLLLVNQRATFVAGELSCRLKVNFVVARYYADKEPRFVSPKHKCFEDCRNIFAEFRGNVLRGEVLL